MGEGYGRRGERRGEGGQRQERGQLVREIVHRVWAQAHADRLSALRGFALFRGEMFL